jgi:acyl-CoA synthetase (AMP-forming)/AMP-acid ligase II
MTENTTGGLISARAALGDKALLVADKDRLTYGDLDRRSRAVAGGLMAAGVRRGSRVAMLFGNKPDFVVAFFAITRIGAIALPISTMSTAEELRGLFDDSDTEFLISDFKYRNRDLVALVKEATGAEEGALATPNLPVMRRIWFGLQALETAGEGHEAEVAAAQAQVSPADVLVVVHTSGSTSKPKGVVHTQGSMIRHARNMLPIRKLTSEDVLFSNSPWFWIGGLVYGLLSTIVAGSRLICSAASAPETLDLLEAERPNLTNGFVGTIMNLVSDPSYAGRDLSFMRGGNLYPLVAEDVRPKDPELRHNLMGMTETGSVYLLGDHENDLPENQRGSFGGLAPDMYTRVIDPETGEETTGEGEIWVRGQALMQGYYGQERHKVFEPGGWFRTGDVMRKDADGLHYFKGRRSGMIKTAGANVSPREVEIVLAELLPGTQPIVLGLPDPERGQIVVAVVVGDGPVDEAGLRQAMKGRLSGYKVPRRIVTMPDAQLPKLSSGKVDMTRLAEVLRAV